MKTTHFALSIALAWLVMPSLVALAQDETAPTMDEGAVVQGQIARQRLTPADTSSFRATLHGFIDACNEVYDLAASTASGTDITVQLCPPSIESGIVWTSSALTGDVRDSMGIESAISLKEVLDRIPLPTDDLIPETSPADGGPEQSSRIPGTRITIEGVEDGSPNESFRFSAVRSGGPRQYTEL